MATRKALAASEMAAPFAARSSAAVDPEAVATHVLERAAQRFAQQETVDALAARIRRLIPRWLRALLPVAAIARAVARFVEQTLDPYADDPAPDA